MTDTKFSIKQKVGNVILTVVIDTEINNNKTRVKENIKCTTIQEAEQLIMDISKINNLGWKSHIILENGLKKLREKYNSL